MTQTAKTYLFFIIYIIFNFISGIAVVSLLKDGSNTMLASAIWQIVFFVPVLFIGVKLFGNRAAETLSLNKTSLADIVLAVLLAIVISPIANLLSAFMSLFFPNAAAGTLDTSMGYSFGLSVLTLCVIPAVFEELVFRGVVFSGLKNMRLSKACVMGGLIFALAHFSLQSILYTFFIGTLFCYVVYRTKSVIPGMAAHFTLNFSQVMLYRAAAAIDSAVNTSVTEAEMVSIIFRYVAMSIFSLPIAAGIIFLMGRKYGRGKPLYALVRKIGFVIEGEEAFDYSPQKQFEDKAMDLRLILILVVYAGSVLYQYF